MKTRQLFHKFLCAFGRVLPGLAFLLLARAAGANPAGLTVVSGSASAQSSGSLLSITTSRNAVLNWSSFNIGAGERTVFNQPSASSIVFNQINNQSASQIYGSLQANGIVVLLNSSGFYFGPNSFVSAAGLVVSTANCLPPQNQGGAWVFNGPPPLASIVNYGQIKIGHGGDCYFIGDQVQNYGDIQAPAGNIAFAAGQTVTLSERPDGRGMSMQVTLPQGSVDNHGNVIADGGTIALNAKVVNQDGLIQANSVRDDNGVIELVASDSLNLGANSQISASGDSSAGGSAAGSVTLQSGGTFGDASGSEITVAGGANGGDGGAVEISAPDMPALNTKIDGQAQPGFTGGSLLLDPDFIVLDEEGTDTPTVNGTSGTVQAGDSPGGTLYFNVNSQFAGLSDITLQAKYDITLADGTAWDLSGSTGQTSGQLILEAGRNIIFGNTTSLTDENNWSVSLYAGVTDFANAIVSPGAGSIYLNAFDPNNPGNVPYDPSGYIMTAAGSITMVAGQDIIVGTGRVVTSAGGSISAHALAGDIDTGGYAQGYDFTYGNTAAGSYSIDPDLGVGGISTMGGGDVNLTAGGNITSVSASQNGNQDGYVYDGIFYSTGANGSVASAGAGAYGIGLPGNVTIVAGGDVTGNYTVADGTGTVVAGAQMDASGNPVITGGKYALGSSGNAGENPDDPNFTGQAFALNLIDGGWNVTAAQDIYLQEVRNPNGDFNNTRNPQRPSQIPGSYHAFDYGSSDYVNLTAGNYVQLGGGSAPPRIDNLNVPVIYPGILNIVAGAGGVELEGNSVFNQLILFPSPLGSLTIDTTDGGSLTGMLPASSGTPQIFGLIISDSGNVQYKSSSGGTFGLNDLAATPVHLGSEMPVSLDISGDMDYVLLGSPEAATITVQGAMNNSRFQGMNLSASDTTSINVTGDIYNTPVITPVDLSGVSGSAVPDLSELGYAQPTPGLPNVATLLASFAYNPVTHYLTYTAIPGANLAAILQLFQNLTVQQVVNGVPQWADAPFDTIPVTTTVSIMNAATAQALLNAYAGPAPSGTYGLEISGGGNFNISADNMNLGNTAGIKSWGAGLYNPLDQYFTTGANITVNLAGDLDMLSSAIDSLNGGDIYVNADGDINVGTADFDVNTTVARGIFSTGQGNVAVYAGGDVDVEGSRIAVYDTRPESPAINTPGGSLTVVSRDGDVNIGSGGSGVVVVNSYYVNPATHQLTAEDNTIAGSGILDVSFNLDGNLLVEAPNGDINIGAGGIQQFLLKESPFSFNSVATLLRLALQGEDGEAKEDQVLFNGVLPGSPVPDEAIYAGNELQLLDNSHQPVLDSFGNPVINAENLSQGTLVAYAPDANINANGSDIAGAGNLAIKASGGFDGNVYALGNVSLAANNNISGTVFGLGTVSVGTSGGSISGTIIGVGGIEASGGSITASLESNGSISGGTSGSTGFAGNAAAGNVAAAAAAANSNPAVTADSDNNSDDDLKKKKPIALAQKVSRVTVILPKKD